MAESLSYFRTTGDRESKVWVFRDDVPSRFLPHPFSSGTDAFQIHIIDLFGGRHPLLVNYHSLTEELQIPFRPTVILDSNVVSYLHQYVTSQPALDKQRRQAVEELLRFVITNRLDYNPFFYYLEAASREKESSLLGHATGISESLLRLHTMDERHFLDCGQIRIDPRILDEYFEEYGVAEFAELAAAYARGMVVPTDPRMQWVSKLSYAVMLKTALIHKSSMPGIPTKYEELLTFMEEKLNIALGAERILALEYFAGRFDGFIPIQQGAVPARALGRVRAASWDLVLLQLPAYLLVASMPGGVYVGFVCTGDKVLNRVARACRIEGVMAWAPDTQIPLPIMTSDLSILKNDIGQDVVSRIREIDSNWQRSRAARLFSSENHISFEALEELTSELEGQIVCYCKN